MRACMCACVCARARASADIGNPLKFRPQINNGHQLRHNELHSLKWSYFITSAAARSGFQLNSVKLYNQCKTSCVQPVTPQH